MDYLKNIGYDYSYWNFINPTKQQIYNPPAITVLDQIKIPTLIITAEYDLECCREIADIMEERINKSKKVTIKNAGHIMNMDDPEEFNALVTEFVDGIK